MRISFRKVEVNGPQEIQKSKKVPNLLESLKISQRRTLEPYVTKLLKSQNDKKEFKRT